MGIKFSTDGGTDEGVVDFGYNKDKYAQDHTNPVEDDKEPLDSATDPVVDPAPNDPAPDPVADDGNTGEPLEDTIPSGNEEIKDFIPSQYSGSSSSSSGTVNLAIPEVEMAGDVALPETGESAEFVPWEVTEEQTVQGQLASLYNRDSPFFESARQKAVRAHMAGGGQNSAMAAAAGETAAMDKAFQVAQQDAAIYARSAEFNAAMQNQFSLAEQRFIHNAMLSDQAYSQSREMEQMRIEAQFESIRMDYQGRSQLMDKELDNWFARASQEHQYALDLLWEQEEAYEGREQRGFSRNMTLNGMLQMTNFHTAIAQNAAQYASNPNFTPQQASAAFREYMTWGSQQFDYLQSFWGQWAAGGPPMGASSYMGGGTQDWYDFSNYNSNTGSPPGAVGGGDSGSMNDH